MEFYVALGRKEKQIINRWRVKLDYLICSIRIVVCNGVHFALAAIKTIEKVIILARESFLFQQLVKITNGISDGEW